MKMDLKKYFEKDKRILIVCSHPFDADGVGSGLMMSKMLKQLGKTTTVIFPGEKTKNYDNLSYLPGFQEIQFISRWKVIEGEKHDALVFVDGSSIVQFYNDRNPLDSPPKLTDYPRRLLVDHHQEVTKNLGTRTIRDTQSSSTAEVILTKLSTKTLIDKDIATLGYAAILGDTGTFQWGYSPMTMKLAGLLLEKGADASVILDRMNFSKSKEYFEILKIAVANTVWKEKLGSCFLFLTRELIENLKLNGDQLSMIKGIFCYDIARRVSEYPLGFVLYADLNRSDVVHLSARGNNLKNKIDLRDFVGSIGGKGGGHFNSVGFDFDGNFDDIKARLLKALEGVVKGLV